MAPGRLEFCVLTRMAPSPRCSVAAGIPTSPHMQVIFQNDLSESGSQAHWTESYGNSHMSLPVSYFVPEMALRACTCMIHSSLLGLSQDCDLTDRGLGRSGSPASTVLTLGDGGGFVGGEEAAQQCLAATLTSTYWMPAVPVPRRPQLGQPKMPTDIVTCLWGQNCPPGERSSPELFPQCSGL